MTFYREHFTPLRSLLGFALLMSLTISPDTMAQVNTTSPDRLWQSLDLNKISLTVDQLSGTTSLPPAFRAFRLDRSRLMKILQNPVNTLSSNTGCTGRILTLPKPGSDDVWLRFCIRESSMMEPELAAQYPTIRTYEGQGLDDPRMTVRLDWDIQGLHPLHAIVLSPNETFYIDPFPLKKHDLSTYMGYFDKDAQQKLSQCLVKTDSLAKKNPAEADNVIPTLSNGDTLRSYRLAVAVTGEYARFQGGTIDAAFRAVLNTINRVNAIYNRDLAIHLVLVKDENKLIFTDPATDPYTNGDDDRLLIENQGNIDRLIGPPNYDIGHVFGVGNGGLAGLGVVGKDGRKAKGETASRSPKGDAFDVDFVAHEIGHQFGANHTFNGTTGSCGGGNRNVSTAFEPGSGSTIMGYAGICGPEDLQPNSDPFFHVASLYEIVSYVTTDAKTVGKLTKTSNAAPVITAASSFRIPKQTAFWLAASANDPNGDQLSFAWEEIDLGKEGPPNDDVSDLRPIFRSFNPETTPLRIFPRISALLNGGISIGEALPTKNRTLNFIVTARDNRAGGGGFATARSEVSVISDSGPFVVTQPDKTASWTVGSTQTVTWNPAGTALPPISCNRVRISFSKDGGKTFGTLIDATPNTGSATIIVPNSPTTAGRIKVEAVGNVFFSLSPADFKVGPG